MRNKISQAKRLLLEKLSNRELGEVLGRFNLPEELIKKVAPLRKKRPKCTCLTFCRCDKKFPDPPINLELLKDTILQKIPLISLLEAANRARGPA